MASEDLDQGKAEAFASRMLDILNGAGLAFMSSIGHQVGLFDTLARLTPSSSQQIAEAAGLNERYVREWLAAMVTGRIIDYDPAAGTYALPREHAASLVQAAGSRNMAASTLRIPFLSRVEEGIVESFRNGGGVPLGAFEGYQQLMADASRPRYDETLISRTLPLVPGLAPRLEAGIDVAEIGCGSGHALNLMAQAYPHSRMAGYDVDEEGIAAARAEADQMGLSNCRFEVKDAAELEVSGRQYDFITAFDVIHDLVSPATVLRGIAHALRPGGIFLMVDIAASSNLHENLDIPMGPFLYANSTMRCMTVSLAEGGEGLGTMWGEQKARQMLRDAGFSGLEFKRVPGDLNYYCIADKG
ncbi:MAG: methyltransferase domain-containing protein [Dehalococcoidia bacterium]